MKSIFVIYSWNVLLFQEAEAECDFKAGAGAGAASVVNQAAPRTRIQRAEQESSKTSTEDDLSDSEINLEDTKELVPVRHSARTASKTYKYKPLLYLCSHKVMNKKFVMCNKALFA